MKPQVVVCASQAGSPSTLEQLVRYTGAGNIHGPYERTNKQPWWSWQCGRSDDVAGLIAEIFPLLSERRQQQIIAAYEART